MENNKHTTIIILAYKEPKKFINMFETLLKNTKYDITPYDIIVVENNPDKEIRTYLDNKEMELDETNIKLTRFFSLENQGTSKGFNKGAFDAKGHYLCFFNSDYYMEIGWLDSMIKCFEHQPNIGLISCATNKTGNPDERIDIIYNKYIILPPVTNGIPTLIVNSPFDYKESDCAIAQMFTTRQIWEEVDGFNEDLFPITFEDLDFNEKIKQKGYKIFVNRKTWGYHDHDDNNEKERKDIMDRNRNLFKEKWGDKFQWA